MYNGKSGGSLYTKLKHLRIAAKQQNNEQIIDESLHDVEPEEEEEAARADEESAKANVTHLKSLLVTPDNMHLIQQKLFETVEYRAKMLQDKGTDLLEWFPYFFVNAKLVSKNNI